MIAKLLDSYCPTDSVEITQKTQMLQFLEEEKDCFSRQCEPGHFTASCWLVNKDFSKALLTHHRKLGHWFQLGGHCDGDSDILYVAIREAEEESGLSNIVPVTGEIFDIDIHEIPANHREKAHMHYDVRFLLQNQGSESFVVSPESNDLMWVTKDKSSLPIVNDTVRRLHAKWIAYS